MFKRFRKYQLLLSASAGFANDKKHPMSHYIILYIFLGILYIMFNEVGLIFFPIVLTLYADYHIINSQNKLFEIVPVSKLYSLVNIYLYVFTMSIPITIGGTVGILIPELFIPSSFTFNINLLVANWKAILVTGCISIIIVSILLPIFFIRLNFLRKSLTISVVTILVVILRLFKNTLPVLTKLGKINFLESITIMPHYNEILLILICVCVVLLPISMLISYRFYKGKRCLVC